MTDSMILIKGECDLSSEFGEDEIRTELVSVFSSEFPLIGKNDFDFMRRVRNVTKPIVKKEHKWDFKHVKNLCGTGRLYVRLNIHKDLLKDDMPGQGQVPFSVSSNSESEGNSSPGPSLSRAFPVVGAEIAVPGPSSSQSSLIVDAGVALSGSFLLRASPEGFQVQELRSIFPDIPECELMSALRIHGSVAGAAEALTDDATEQSCLLENTLGVQENCQNVSDNLRKLRNKMESGYEKLKVEEEDVLTDVLHYYKDPEFNPRKKLRISLNARLAIDTGGVLRQVFSDVF